MTNDTILEKTGIDVSILANLAKASYCKDKIDERKGIPASDAMKIWASEYKGEVLALEGNKPEGSYSLLGGFNAVSYKNGNEIVIAFRGTDSFLDIAISDLQIALGKIPQQANSAIKYYEMVRQAYPDCEITITGHSLGGALAQYVASAKNENAVTFNAPGISMPQGGSTDNIVNYVNLNDFIGSFGDHIGTTKYYIPDGIYSGEYKPHSDFLDNDFSKYIESDYLDENWTPYKALAIAKYDITNKTTAFVATENQLKAAIQDIQEIFGKTGELDRQLVYVAGKNKYIISTSENDHISTDIPNNNTVYANDGDDFIFLFGQNNYIDAGAGNDVIYGMDGNDTIIGGIGNDDLSASRGKNVFKFYTNDGQDSINATEEEILSVRNILYNNKQSSIEINDLLATGGTQSSTQINTYNDRILNNVTYEWSGENNTILTIHYGNNDTVEIKNFKNGEYGLFFDESIEKDKDEIINQLKRQKQAYADMIVKGEIVDASKIDIPQLKYQDTNGQLWDIIDCENTSKLLNGYSEKIVNGIIDETNTYIMVKAGELLKLEHTPVDYSNAITDMQNFIAGKEVKTQDLPIQGTDIYIPTSSTEGSPTLQNVYYQYTSRPSDSFLIGSLLTVVQIAACVVTGNWWGAGLVAFETGIAGKTAADLASLVDTANLVNTLRKNGIKGLTALFDFVGQGNSTGAAADLLLKGGISIDDIINGAINGNVSANGIEWNKIFKTSGIDGYRLFNVLINNSLDPNADYNEFSNLNPLTGSNSPHKDIYFSSLDEPDVSTPDKKFDLNAKENNKGCPLILDLDNDGVETLDIDKTNIYFNVQNSDFLNKTGWVNGDDGLLAVDKDGDGKITKQNELFGSENTSGFSMLAEYDTNNDGVINAADQKFQDLKIWQDINENGITDNGELKSLTEMGISSINLKDAVAVNTIQNQNAVTGMSSYTKTDGKIGGIYNVEFAFNKLYTKYNGDYALSLDVLNMPWLRGYGLVEDLQLKMSKDESLKNYVADLMKINNAKQLYDKMDEFLAKWVGCDNISPTEKVGSINARQLEILNKYLNLDFEGLVPQDKLAFFQSAYINLKNKIYVNFIAQTELGNLFEVNYDYKNDAMLFNDNTYEKLITNLTNTNNYFASYIIAKVLNNAECLDGNKLAFAITEKGYGASLISYLNSGFEFTENGEITYNDGNIPLYVIGSENGELIEGTDNADIIYGMDGDDILKGGAGDDFLVGGSGNDTLYGGDGNDTLVGGVGDDSLEGGYGNDVYIYDGDGKDVVSDERWIKIARQEWYLKGWWIFKKWDYRWVYQDQLVDGGLDTIIFDKNIHIKDILITQNNNDLVISLKETNNKLTIKNWYETEEKRVERFVFNDGFIITSEQFLGYIADSSSDDMITGTDNNNFIMSTEGNDTILAAKGDDSIANITGDTTYLFNIGDGNDIINDYSGNDKIIFGEGIKESDIEYYRNNKDLIISIKNLSESITILNWFNNDNNKIETLIFNDGTVKTTEDILEKLSITIATGYDDIIIGNELNNRIDGLSGNDYIEGRGGDDTIIGGLGKDIMKGGAGSDVYYVDNEGDVIVEELNEDGSIENSIYSTVSYELPDNVRWLYLEGEADINGRGNKQDNTIMGNNGNNILDGNAGNNILMGGYGDDTYIINESNKTDTPIESEGKGTDTIISSIDYKMENYEIENLILVGDAKNGNGNSYNNYIKGNEHDNILKGLNGNDTLEGVTGKDTLIGGFGDDTYIINDTNAIIQEDTNSGTDTIISSINYTITENVENMMLSGNDNITATGNLLNNIIIGNDGNNTLWGGLGNDTLNGGKGGDTYIFNLGDGEDIINENDPYSNSVDVLKFGAGIAKDKVKFEKIGYDLIITIEGTNDKITIKNSNLAFGSRIERFEFADGSFINGQDLYTLVCDETKNTLYADAGYLKINSKSSVVDREYYDNGYLKSEIFYNESREITEEKNYNVYGQLETRKIYIYDDAGKITRCNLYYGMNNTIQNSWFYEYDEQGKLTDIIDYVNNSSTVQERVIYTYNNNNQVTNKRTNYGYYYPKFNLNGTTTNIWGYRIKENIAYTYTNGLLTKEVTLGEYTQMVSEQVGGITHTYNKWYTHETQNVTYTYNNKNQITNKHTNVGYYKPVFNLNGTYKDVWSFRTDEDITYNYNNDGVLTSEIKYGAYEALVSETVGGVTHTYNKWFTRKSGETTYEYDNNGLLTKKLELVGSYLPKFNPNGTLSNVWGMRTKEEISYTYNDLGLVTSETRLGDYNKLTRKEVNGITYTYYVYATHKTNEVIYTYNKYGQMLSKKTYIYSYDTNDTNGTAELYDSIKNVYDENNRLIESKHFVNSSIYEAYKYSYIIDENGYLIKQTVQKANIVNGQINSYSTYQEININSYYNNLTGNEQNNNLVGSNQNDYLMGNAGVDTLFGSLGNDTLDGGEGADILIGANGDDTYIIDNINDKIIEYENEGIDTVKTSLNNYALKDYIEKLILTGNANLTANGNMFGNSITGNTGNNILNGLDGNDILIGIEGNDSLNGGENNDTLIGGTGNDSLFGGNGDDIYCFSANDNNDIISDSSGKRDCIMFDETVKKDQIAVYKDGDNLIIDYGESFGSDTITINGQFLSESSIEKVQLNDGSYITNYDINQLIQNMTAYANNNDIEFTGIDSVKNSEELMNLVANSWHS